jgi:hypothetical protein
MTAQGNALGSHSNKFPSPERAAESSPKFPRGLILRAMAPARQSKASAFAQQRLFAGLSSFAELEQRVANLPDEKSRGDVFGSSVQAFHRIEPEYASRLKHVWLFKPDKHERR